MPSKLSPSWPLAIAAIDAVGERILQFLRETPMPGLRILPPSTLAQYHTLLPLASSSSRVEIVFLLLDGTKHQSSAQAAQFSKQLRAKGIACLCIALLPSHLIRVGLSSSALWQLRLYAAATALCADEPAALASWLQQELSGILLIQRQAGHEDSIKILAELLQNPGAVVWVSQSQQKQERAESLVRRLLAQPPFQGGETQFKGRPLVWVQIHRPAWKLSFFAGLSRHLGAYFSKETVRPRYLSCFRDRALDPWRVSLLCVRKN